MTIKEAFLLWLNTDTAIKTLVQTRNYWMRAPQSLNQQKSMYPYTVTTRVSDARVGTFLGPSGLASPRFQLDCYASGTTGAKDVENLAETVRLSTGGTAGLPDDSGHNTKLDGFKGLMGVVGGVGGVKVHSSKLLDRRDEWERPVHDDEFGVHRISLDFMIWHEEPV